MVKTKLILAYFAGLTTLMGMDTSALSNSYNLEYYGKYEEAWAAGEKLAAENPKEYFFQLRAAWLAYLAGKYTRSFELYQNALILKPDATEPRLGQLFPLMALGKYKQAEVVAQSVLRSDPKNYTARIKLAYSLYLAGEFSRSEKYYGELALEFPSDATVLMGFGWAELKQGKKGQARENFQRVKMMFPENKYADEGLYWAK